MDPLHQYEHYTDPDGNDDDEYRLPACYRCHASKLRCTRAPGMKDCKRCIRSQAECKPRPSRRGHQASFSTTTRSRRTAAVPSSAASPLTTQSNSSTSGEASPNTAAVGLFGNEDHSALWSEPGVASSLMDGGFGLTPIFEGATAQDRLASFGIQQLFEDRTAGISDDIDGTLRLILGQGTPPMSRQDGNSLLEEFQSPGPTGASVGPATRWSEELGRINSVLLAHEKTLLEAISSVHEIVSAAQPVEPEDSSYDCLKIQETLRAALDVLGLFRQCTCPLLDSATSLLLFSCYMRLVSIFHSLFRCLLELKDQQGNATSLLHTLPRLFPRVQMGPLSLDDISTRLQAMVVVDSSERILAEISACVRSLVGSGSVSIETSETRNRTHSRNGPGENTLARAVMQMAELKHGLVLDCIGKLKRGWI